MGVTDVTTEQPVTQLSAVSRGDGGWEEEGEEGSAQEEKEQRKKGAKEEGIEKASEL